MIPNSRPPRRLPKGWQLRKGVYYRRVRANGRDKLIRLGLSREEASVTDGRLAPRLQSRVAARRSAFTVDEFVERFRDERAVARRNNQGVALLEQRHRDYVSPVIGRLLVVELEADPSHLYRLRVALDAATRRSDDTRHLSARSVHHILCDVRCWLRYAERVRLIDRSPFHPELLPVLDDRPVKAPSDVELARALAAAPPGWLEPSLWSLYTGMRYGEVRAIDRADVVLESPERAIVWRSHGGSTKTRKSRVVWLVPEAVDLVRVEKGRLFPGLPESGQWFNRAVQRVVPGFTFHQFRHACAAALRADGASESLIGDQLGQSQARTTWGYGDDSGKALRERLLRAVSPLRRLVTADGDNLGDLRKGGLEASRALR